MRVIHGNKGPQSKRKPNNQLKLKIKINSRASPGLLGRNHTLPATPLAPNTRILSYGS